MNENEREAQKLIMKEYGRSRNFMTPNIHEYGFIKTDRAYEISWGKGIFTEYMVGVSIVDYDPTTGETTRDPEGLSTAFSGDNLLETIQEAKNYIDTLKE